MLWKDFVDDDVRLCEGTVDVASLDTKMHGDVLVGLLELRRIVLQCLLRIEHRRQFLILDEDGLHCALGGLNIAGGNRRHFLPDIAHFTDRQGVLIGNKKAPRDLRRVLTGDHRIDTRNGLCRARRRC